MIGETVSPELVERYQREGLWPNNSLAAQLDRQATERPHACAYIEDGSQFTFEDLDDEIDRIARLIGNLGLQKGHAVAIHLPNSVAYVAWTLAVNRIGGIVVPRPPEMPESDLSFVHSFAQVDAAVALEGSTLGKASESTLSAISDGGISSSAHTTAGLDVTVIVTSPREPQPGYGEGDKGSALCRFLFTSGSTGAPKCVVHDNNSTVLGIRLQDKYTYVSTDSKALVCIPVWLNWGMFQVLSPVITGSSAVIIDDFDPERVISLVGEHDITHLGVPPTGLLALLDQDPDWAQLDSLEIVSTAGAPCPTHVIDAMMDRIGVPVIEGYGMTEAGWICVSSRDPSDYRVGSVGRPVDGTEIRLADSDASEPSRDDSERTTGEVVVRNPTLFREYLKNPSANESVWESGRWFHTGDLGRFDEQGRLYIEGRIKDTIKHGGHLIAPDEIEDKLFKHAQVSDVAVIGVPDEYFGENICACVVPSSWDDPPELDDLIEYLRDKLPKHKLPQQLEVMRELPRTRTGKVQKNVLREKIVQ